MSAKWRNASTLWNVMFLSAVQAFVNGAISFKPYQGELWFGGHDVPLHWSKQIAFTVSRHSLTWSTTPFVRLPLILAQTFDVSCKLMHWLIQASKLFVQAVRSNSTAIPIHNHLMVSPGVF
jgi:hypothetical protein